MKLKLNLSSTSAVGADDADDAVDAEGNVEEGDDDADTPVVVDDEDPAAPTAFELFAIAAFAARIIGCTYDGES